MTEYEYCGKFIAPVSVDLCPFTDVFVVHVGNVHAYLVCLYDGHADCHQCLQQTRFTTSFVTIHEHNTQL